MNISKFLACGAIVIGMSLGLHAQEQKKFSVGANAIVPLNSLKNVTNADAFGGLTVDFGYHGLLANSGVPFRANLAVGYMPGKEEDGLKVSLMNYQLSGDILTRLGSDDLHLVTGISINKWRVTGEAGGVKESENVDGLKFGGRLGLDYRFSEQWSGNIMLQAIELGAHPLGWYGINPSWIQVGAKFHF